MEVIVRFLALLELCKLGRVTLGQGTTFGDLRSTGWPTTTTGRRDQRPRPGASWPATRSTTTKDERADRWRRRAGPHIEAILLVAVEPVPPQPAGRTAGGAGRAGRGGAGRAGAESYERERRGFVLARIAGGARLQTHPDLAPYVERFANRDVSHRLSTAALETLAIVAYRQPVSRGQISALRGVNVDGVIRLLEQRGYIEVVGHAEGPGPARAVRHHRPLPGAPRARLAGPAAAGRGLPARARSGRAISSASCRPALGVDVGTDDA